jgi:hypothetical protein
LSSNPAPKECVPDPLRIDRFSHADIAHLSASNISEARQSCKGRSSLSCAKAVEKLFFWWKSKEKVASEQGLVQSCRVFFGK